MESDTDTPRNKVQSVIEKRDLGDLVAELEQRWHGDGFEEHSTRELADFFNRTIVRQAIRSTGSIPLEGEVENFYRLLTDGEVRSGSAMQARDRLGEYGIDPTELEADFVSHQTMYRFLKNVRDIDTSSETKSLAEMISTTQESLRRLNSRTQAVVTRNIDQLNKREEFTVGDFDVFVNVQVACNDCGTTGDVIQLLDENGCECPQ
jgi:hypothetical protein